jgi:hypothetical protein
LGPIGDQILADLKNKSEAHGLRFKFIRELYSHYTPQQLANHRAVILFPYAVMTYSITDFYDSTIPIFIPSIEFLTKFKLNMNERTVKFGHFCGNDADEIKPHTDSAHKYSPNDDSDDAFRHWISYADYFQWPYVTVFYSFDDLFIKLKTLDLREISNKMKSYNRVKEAHLLDNWCRVLKHETRNSIMPKSFQEALVYFNMTY